MIIKMVVWLIVAIGGNLAWHIIGIVKFKSKPNYWLTGIFRGACLVFFGVWCTPGLEWHPGLELWGPELFPIIGFCVCSFIVFFNPGMNLLKNKFAEAKKVGFLYYGKTSGLLAPLFDRWPWLYKALYFASVPGLIYFAIKMITQ